MFFLCPSQSLLPQATQLGRIFVVTNWLTTSFGAFPQVLRHSNVLFKLGPSTDGLSKPCQHGMMVHFPHEFPV